MPMAEATRGLRVAIVGGGPAGAALATLLTQDGHDVVLYDDGRRPELVVEEHDVVAVEREERRERRPEGPAPTIATRRPRASRIVPCV
jgi:2-polyprenyl-6-methoxyphenol hydroxylase-like FAD-dependent oxidoreductase